MKYYNISLIILLAAALLGGGCVNELLEEPDSASSEFVEGELVKVPLSLSVNPYTVKNEDGTRVSEPSATPEPESPEERQINDIWVFQFDAATGARLTVPRYYDAAAGVAGEGILSEPTTAPVYANLSENEGKPSTIYIVANTGDKGWISGDGPATLEELKKMALRSPYPIMAGNDENGQKRKISIPMSGMAENVTVTADKSTIVVPVTRMYAKLKINVNVGVDGMRLYNINVMSIPWYCRVSTVAEEKDANGEPLGVDLKTVADNSKLEYISRAFDEASDIIEEADGKRYVVIYVPEVICGEINNPDQTKDKLTSGKVPPQALAIQATAKYDGYDCVYTAYPGGNNYNNFNVQRNNVYRVTMKINTVMDAHRPSSNCFVVKPGELLSFEPYNRIENGGGYDIKTYLDPDDPAKTIDHVKIIWQTKGCIGDNEHIKLIELIPATPARHTKIKLTGGAEGNALIGGYNANGDIVWSWHIWVTKNEPDNIGNAVVYTTYKWDSQKIYSDEPRVPGFGIMPCNLGALEFEAGDMRTYSISPEERYPEDQVKTFGMLYQWGRKDPFPPMICSTGTEDLNGTLDYTNRYTEVHFGNDNTTEVDKTSEITYYDKDDPTDYLFYTKSIMTTPKQTGGNIFYPTYESKIGVQSESESILYAIQHPTAYIAAGYSTTSIFSTTGFTISNNGDWLYNNNNTVAQLWGAKDGGQTFSIDSGSTSLHDNIGSKSIFDPCPNGWRMPSGDLWLGFTSTGLNPVDFTEVNYSEVESGHRPGMYMFVQGWHTGPKVYFPLQGTRTGSGEFGNVGLCGNYHNATCDRHRVNILHLHRNMAIVTDPEAPGHQDEYKYLMLFRIFEYKNENYYIKSTASPVRCVRDSK